jgi:hypothetical protein
MAQVLHMRQADFVIVVPCKPAEAVLVLACANAANGQHGTMHAMLTPHALPCMPCARLQRQQHRRANYLQAIISQAEAGSGAAAAAATAGGSGGGASASAPGISRGASHTPASAKLSRGNSATSQQLRNSSGGVGVGGY